MTTARRRLVDPAVTRWYHCISRCVRRAYLLGEDGLTNRKAWIQNRLKELCDVFAISVAGFSILDNHLHVLARLDPEVAKTWSDEEVLRRWTVYIDLNPLAAGITFLPEKSPYTSITERVEYAWPKLSRADLQAALRGLVVANLPAGDVEQTHWLCPIEDRRELGAEREGMLLGFSLPKYLLLLDYTAHIFRQGKARLSAEIAPIFERLGTTAEMWEQRLTQLKTTLDCRKFTGRFLATTREVLTAAAQRLGLHHLVNLAGREHFPAPIKPAPIKPAPSG